MISAIPFDSQIVSLQPLNCDMTTALMCPETAFAQAFIALSEEICWHDFIVIVDSNSDLPRSHPGTFRFVETRAKSATAWPDCMNEWNIRDP
jgi:hypothetical protein